MTARLRQTGFHLLWGRLQPKSWLPAHLEATKTMCLQDVPCCKAGKNRPPGPTPPSRPAPPCLPPAIRWRSQLIFIRNSNRAVVLTNVNCHCISFAASLGSLKQFSDTPHSKQRQYRVSCQLKPEDARAERAVTAVLAGVFRQPTARDDL